MTISGAFNKVENAAGSNSAVDKEATILNVAFAF